VEPALGLKLGGGGRNSVLFGVCEALEEKGEEEEEEDADSEVSPFSDDWEELFGSLVFCSIASHELLTVLSLRLSSYKKKKLTNQ
jgi:hypothetical protein